MNIVSFFGRLLRDNSANALAIFAAALVPMVLMVGSGLDLGITYMARAKLQNACDAGVLAGRQAMQGTAWTSAVETEADKFFNFNFPEGTHGAVDLTHAFIQNSDDRAELLGTASARIPTSLMYLFGFADLPIAVECNAKRDLGHNDVMLVLDVTGSMNDAPSTGGSKKIVRLRSGTLGLYRALDDDGGDSVTRFGIMPYSWTVNVGRSLVDNDILDSQSFLNATCSGSKCNSYTYSLKTVTAANSTWRSKSAFRTSGSACIEERSSIGETGSSIRINDTVTRDDIDKRSDSSTNTALQFGRYDPQAHTYRDSYTSGTAYYLTVGSMAMQYGCPSEASRLKQYDSESAFQSAVNSATAKVTGGTYHDVGMLWGLRFLSRTGFFSADNPTEIGDIPVNQHIVFMTDGKLDTGANGYTAHGVESKMSRTRGSGTQSEKHLSRFDAVCARAKAMGVTVWVIALDVTDTDDISPCATSPAHFYTSDGSDLEEVFEAIGQGIGNLRLTR